MRTGIVTYYNVVFYRRALSIPNYIIVRIMIISLGRPYIAQCSTIRISSPDKTGNLFKGFNVD